MKKRADVKLLMVFLMLVLLAGCAKPIMHEVEPITLEGQGGKAMVTFLRESSFWSGNINLGVWDSADLVGVLLADTYIQYLAEPGEHVFLVRAENWSYVKADLEAGKHYFILANFFPGIWKARVALDPIKKDDTDDIAEIDSLLAELTPLGVIPEMFDAYADPRTEQVRNAAAQVDNGSVMYEVLSKEDGR